MKKNIKNIIMLSFALFAISSCNNNSSENENLNKDSNISDIISDNSSTSNNNSSTSSSTSDSQINAYTVSGFVTDDGDSNSFKPIAGITLTLTNANDSNETYTATTGVDGKYIFTNIKSGDYTLSVTSISGSYNNTNSAKEIKVRDANITVERFILEYDGSTWGSLQ